jgi:hypothetical protein
VVSAILLNWTLISRSIQVSQIAPWNRLPLSHCDIDDILLKWQNQVSNKIGVKRSVPGLSFMEKEQEKITLQPNIYRRKNKQHQIEHQRLSSHPCCTPGVTDPVRIQHIWTQRDRHSATLGELAVDPDANSRCDWWQKAYYG